MTYDTISYTDSNVNSYEGLALNITLDMGLYNVWYVIQKPAPNEDELV